MENKNLKSKSFEKKVNQIEWQNIYFDELGIELSPHNLPNSDFYSKFYTHLFKRYKEYGDLPKSWLHGKEETAKRILQELSVDDTILSYGCGIGYIEKKLKQFNKNIEIDSYDFSDMASRWIKMEKLDINYINQLPIGKEYNFIYLCQLMYAIPYSECVALLISLSNKLKPNGRLLMINTSTISSENGVYVNKFISKLKAIYHFANQKIGYIPTNKKMQLWGWERNNAKYCEMAFEANLKIIKIYSAENQSFIVLSK